MRGGELIRRKRFNLKEGFFLSLIRTLGFTGAIILIGILFFIAYNGVRVLSWEFITQPPVDAMTKGGIFPVIIGTILLTFICMIVVIPIGVLRAASRQWKTSSDASFDIPFSTKRDLAGVPSVVF